jgi:TolB-like protein/DNA-binding SARP family transcriptional activator
VTFHFHFVGSSITNRLYASPVNCRGTAREAPAGGGISALARAGKMRDNDARGPAREEDRMAPVAVALFGGFEIRADGAARGLPGQKDRALLAILALPSGAAHSRERLAALLWSDRGDPHARDSLKHALARVRAALDASVLLADRQSVRLDPAVAVDVAEFERLLAGGTPEGAEAALALYRGDLLHGIAVRDPAFHDWLRVERARLRGLAEEAAAGLMARSLAGGAHDRAAAAARRLVELDPCREDASRTLMRYHADRGEAARALRLYEDLRDRLRRELAVRPEPETVELAEAIRHGRESTTRPATDAPLRPPLPDRPSIAVLPFENLSGDPAQDYFADGVVEEIITALSRMRWLFVIARNSSFTYKGRAVDVKQVGRELGVRYVLEGSVRVAAGRVRITGHLIDAATGVHLWAGGFDGELADIFELQDRVTASVVGALAPELERAEIERARRKPTASLDAYDYFLRGMAEVHKWKREANAEALRLFGKAIELDPDFAAAWGMAARCLSQRKASGWAQDEHADIAEVRRLAWRAAELGAEDAVALATAGVGLAYVAGDIDDGRALLERSLALNPNLAMTWLFSGWANIWYGEPEVGLEQLAHAMRLSPHDPQIGNMQVGTAAAHFFAGRDDEAIAWAKAALRTQPDYRIGACILAASHASRGEMGEARAAMAYLRRIDPAFRISNLPKSFPMHRPGHLAKLIDGLRRAGLPE